jgi:renalase
MSGLTAARRLQEQGMTVTVVDKGRGVGGRLSTRRLAIGDGREGKADHGAQYITAHEPDFISLLTELRTNNIVQEWQTTSGAPPATPRFYAPNGMTSIAKYLASGITTRLQERVLSIKCTESAWEAHTDTETILQADALVLTPPVPQTMMLMETLAAEVRQTIMPEPLSLMLNNVEYTRSIVLMLAMKESPRFPGQPLAPKGGLRIDKSAVWWVADNQRKGTSPDVPTLTLHATPTFSLEHWETRDEELLPLMFADVADIFGMQEILTHSIHRWRYSRVMKPFPERFCALKSNVPCILAGDAFTPSEWLPTRAEDAALSGLAAAEHLLSLR